MMWSRIASAIVGSPTMSYQLEEGYCDVMMMDFRSCLSSMMSSSMGRSLASRGTMNRSSRMSNWHRSIFLSSVSSVPLTLATFSAPSSFGALVYKVRNPLLHASWPTVSIKRVVIGRYFNRPN